MKASELKGKKVITIPGGEDIGTVEDVLLRPVEQRLGALVVKSPRFGGLQILLAEDIISSGGDAVTIESAYKLKDQALLGESAQMASFGEASKHKVVTASGNYAGELSDVYLDPATGKITGYAVAGGLFARMLGDSHTIDANSNIRLGKDLLIVPDQAVPAQSEEAVPPTGTGGTANTPPTP
jgi:uncharacterized protein YrrD